MNTPKRSEGVRVCARFSVPTGAIFWPVLVACCAFLPNLSPSLLFISGHNTGKSPRRVCWVPQWENCSFRADTRCIDIRKRVSFSFSFRTGTTINSIALVQYCTFRSQALGPEIVHVRLNLKIRRSRGLAQQLILYFLPKRL